MQIPADTKEFAINMSNMRHWDAPMKRYIDECLAGKEGPRGKDFNMRWVGSMVADVHRILTRGGIFLYPWDQREPNKPGKLRLMYEANPMAWLVEQAGGAATNGRQRILDIQPGQLHERVSVFLGSKNEVERVTSYHERAIIARLAGVAQSVEQLIRNEKVGCSIHLSGTNTAKKSATQKVADFFLFRRCNGLRPRGDDEGCHCRRSARIPTYSLSTISHRRGPRTSE